MKLQPGFYFPTWTFLNELSAILQEIEKLGKVITLSTEMKIWIIHCKTTLQAYDILG